jgi:amino acid transporter
MSLSPLRVLLGRPLANREQASRKIGPLEAVPTMGLDGLGSAAYGPEAALTILAPLGAAGLHLAKPLIGLITALLVVLYFSYRQTVKAYPSNGGAYVVARENLGVQASLLAAAAIMIDYVLNAAVGVSAGVAALTSVLPGLQPYTLPVCLGVLAAITLANLRGLGESGRLFGAPTYLFLASFLFILGLGVVRSILSGGHPHPLSPPPPLPRASESLTLWLWLRAFASGCTAMTGVEAVSNGVDVFREPVVDQARRTLTLIVGALAVLLIGVSVLAGAYQVGAMDQTRPGYQSVLSQLAGAVVGRGWLYDVAMGSVTAVLCLSAATSFVGFPNLCRLLARDDFLPRPFATVGRRLVYSVGIVYLAVTSGLLLAVFGGVTDRLIPLFAIGAFMTFTLSQAGMVAHWRRTPGRHLWPLAINALGAVCTGAALLVILAAKFVEGAWITALAVPAVIALLTAVKRYYARLAERTRCRTPLKLEETEPPTLLVAFQDWSQLSAHALRFAMTLSPDVLGVHLMALEGPDVEERASAVKETWAAMVERPLRASGVEKPPRLVLLQAPYRSLHEPLLKFIRRTDDETPGRSVAVLIPELVKLHWWQHLLHNGRAGRLREMLLREGGSRLIVIDVPWRSDQPARPKPFADEGARARAASGLTHPAGELAT